jgi:hypothetical protein
MFRKLSRQNGAEDARVRDRREALERRPDSLAMFLQRNRRFHDQLKPCVQTEKGGRE